MNGAGNLRIPGFKSYHLRAFGEIQALCRGMVEMGRSKNNAYYNTESLSNIPLTHDLSSEVEGNQVVKDQLTKWALAQPTSAQLDNPHGLIKVDHPSLQFYTNDASFYINQSGGGGKDRPSFLSEPDISLIHIICTVRNPCLEFNKGDFTTIKDTITLFKQLWDNSGNGERSFRDIMISSQYISIARHYFDVPEDQKRDGWHLESAVWDVHKLQYLETSLFNLRSDHFFFGIIPQRPGGYPQHNFHQHIVAAPAWCQKHSGTAYFRKMKDAWAFQNAISGFYWTY